MSEIDLFDGISLDGWHAIPREYGRMYPGGPTVAEVIEALPADYHEQARRYPAVWTVEDGAIVGRQDPRQPGYGGYLVTDRAYGDFDLVLEMKPDWPADTGVMVRRRPDEWAGFQVLVDHRKSGSIGGFFGNGLAGFHAVPYALDVSVDADGQPNGLVEEDAATSEEPVTPHKRALLKRAGDASTFLRSWRWADWNELRIRCVGELPVITTWVNGNLVAEIDTASIVHPHYDAEAVRALLGARGHLALEVHDNDPIMGSQRWAPGVACRWRNLRLTEL